MERLPLGEFSKSALNSLGSSGPVLTTSMHDSKAIGNGPILPSIRSLINHRQELELGGSNLMSKSFDNHINRLRHNQLMPLTLRYEVPVSKSQTSIAALISEPRALDSQNTNAVRTQEQRAEDIKKYSDISKKLQIRLQFAYYKYKTKQTDLNFKDLKAKQTSRPQKDTKKITKRRKLMVSQGNFKTPAKRKDHRKFLNHSQDTSVETSLSSNASSLMSKRDSTLNYEDGCDTTTDFTTPIRRSNALQKSAPKQDTPMSVKAAKSLIFLYSSRA